MNGRVSVFAPGKETEFLPSFTIFTVIKEKRSVELVEMFVEQTQNPRMHCSDTMLRNVTARTGYEVTSVMINVNALEADMFELMKRGSWTKSL